VNGGSTWANLWFMLGDNAYETAPTPVPNAVFDTRRLRQWWCGPRSATRRQRRRSEDGRLLDIFSLPTKGEAGGVPSGTEAYYAFDYGSIHFVCLDSSESDRSPTGPMLRWLDADLAANKAPWLVAFWHHPPYARARTI
jgi:hypothetical protein